MLGIWRQKKKPERHPVSAPQHPLVFTEQMTLKSTWNKENLLEAMLPHTSPIKKQNSRNYIPSSKSRQKQVQREREEEGGRGRMREEGRPRIQMLELQDTNTDSRELNRNLPRKS